MLADAIQTGPETTTFQPPRLGYSVLTREILLRMAMAADGHGCLSEEEPAGIGKVLHPI